jgi:hypothetical protein
MDEQYATLKPASDEKIVRKEGTGALLAKEGERVLLTKYWRRRLADGDVVKVSNEISED